jgi:hypothetical protein
MDPTFDIYVEGNLLNSVSYDLTADDQTTIKWTYNPTTQQYRIYKINNEVDELILDYVDINVYEDRGGSPHMFEMFGGTVTGDIFEARVSNLVVSNPAIDTILGVADSGVIINGGVNINGLVEIDGTLQPLAHDTYSLGTTTRRWDEIHAKTGYFAEQTIYLGDKWKLTVDETHPTSSAIKLSHASQGHSSGIIDNEVVLADAINSRNELRSIVQEEFSDIQGDLNVGNSSPELQLIQGHW